MIIVFEKKYIKDGQEYEVKIDFGDWLDTLDFIEFKKRVDLDLANWALKVREANKWNHKLTTIN